MNYIKRLQKENTELRAELSGLRSGLTELQSYLMSRKFMGDGNDWVNVKDVLLRLNEAEMLAVDEKARTESESL